MMRLPADSVAEMLDRQHAATVAEVYFRVAVWLSGLQTVPPAERIREHFGVSRATAYRWRSAWCNARGVE